MNNATTNGINTDLNQYTAAVNAIAVRISKQASWTGLLREGRFVMGDFVLVALETMIAAWQDSLGLLGGTIPKHRFHHQSPLVTRQLLQSVTFVLRWHQCVSD
ncbi:hypothetical protein RBSH_04069 [Rhodopirellula baltica SH28]|uniref:Uncharacterized protein n=1 Tax=Rhodopirellula baltica SH28 TaxID=993517 RepID=K5DDV4_RHOBT|nr:hypothetical protein [Rhodopirellula baltica]EKK00623.1 hypothetical protein RBSH_04069 [Rhodopirellula baltica SH28]